MQHCTFYPVGSRAVLERHPVFHRPALFPTAQKSQHCTAQHPKGQYNKKNPGSFYAVGAFLSTMLLVKLPFGADQSLCPSAFWRCFSLFHVKQGEGSHGECGLPRRGQAPPRNDRGDVFLPSPWGRVARKGRVRDRTEDMHRIGFSRTLIRLLRRHLPPRGRLAGESIKGPL